MQVHPSAWHLTSLAACFLISVAKAAAPSWMLVSFRVAGVRGEVMVTSQAAGLPYPIHQLAHQLAENNCENQETSTYFNSYRKVSTMAQIGNDVLQAVVSNDHITSIWNCMVATWVQSNVRTARTGGSGRRIQAKPPLHHSMESWGVKTQSKANRKNNRQPRASIRSMQKRKEDEPCW